MAILICILTSFYYGINPFSRKSLYAEDKEHPKSRTGIIKRRIREGWISSWHNIIWLAIYGSCYVAVFMVLFFPLNTIISTLLRNDKIDRSVKFIEDIGLFIYAVIADAIVSLPVVYFLLRNWTYKYISYFDNPINEEKKE